MIELIPHNIIRSALFKDSYDCTDPSQYDYDPKNPSQKDPDLNAPPPSVGGISLYLNITLI